MPLRWSLEEGSRPFTGLRRTPALRSLRVGRRSLTNCPMHARLSFILFCCLVSQRLLADGPADNIAEKVRPVPPKGATISAEDRQTLEQGVADLRHEIEGLRTLLTKQAQQALLPDVEIFYNAVRYAVDYNEIFNATNEVAAAKAAIKLGLERADQLRVGRPPWLSATGLVVR